jgi:hypothetical protein
MRNAQKDTTGRVDAFRNFSVNVPKNGFQGNSVNVKTPTWFIINSTDILKRNLIARLIKETHPPKNILFHGVSPFFKSVKPFDD